VRIARVSKEEYKELSEELKRCKEGGREEHRFAGALIKEIHRVLYKTLADHIS